MKDEIKYFLYGLLLGSKQIERLPAPIAIPVKIINIGYNSDTLEVGETAILTASIFPIDATYQEVEWSSSDINIIAINKITPTAAEIKAIESGTCTITCRATDGSGVVGNVILNVKAGVMIETLSLAANRLGAWYIQYGNNVVEFNYTPVEADGKKIKIKMFETNAGEYDPYVVEDTMFDNIKLIKNTWPDKTQFPLGFISNGAQNRGGRIFFDVNTVDGSNLQILNTALDTNYVSAALTVGLYGKAFGDTSSVNFNNTATYRVQLGADYPAIQFFNGISQCIRAKDIKLASIDDPECLDFKDGWCTFLKEGSFKVVFEINRGEGVSPYTANITLEIKNTLDSGASSGRINLTMIDTLGCAAAYQGAKYTTHGNNKFKIGPGGYDNRANYLNGCKVVLNSVSNPNVAKINTEDNTFEFVGPGSVNINYTMYYGENLSLSYTANYSYTFALGASSGQKAHLQISKVNSDYIKDGFVLAVYSLNTAAANSWNGYNINKLFPIYNANKVKLLSTFDYSGTALSTVTYDPALPSSHGPMISYFNFKKLVDEDVTIGFNINNWDATYTEITL